MAVTSFAPRLIIKFDLDMIFMAGPGHGAAGVLGPAHLEGPYSEIQPQKSEDTRGLHEFFKQPALSSPPSDQAAS
jgi:xylulose-5-phosphate/fructose-6-phosphate phosphoketolase